MAVIGVFTALDFILARFASIPIFNGNGYLNLSDIIVFLLAALINPWAGGLVGGIAGLISDLVQGYVFYAPFTFFIKLIEGVVSGYLFRLLRGHLCGDRKVFFAKSLISFILGGLVMGVLYVIPDCFTYLTHGAFEDGTYIILFIDLGFNCLQGIINAVLAALLILSLGGISSLFMRFGLYSKREEKEIKDNKGKGENQNG